MPIDLNDRLSEPRPRYSICTLVNRPGEYSAMIASFKEGGFTEPECEFIFADNTKQNRYDGFSGTNAFLAVARGEYIIVCHQDVRLIDRCETLDARLAELSTIDPLWAACGNAGMSRKGTPCIRVSDPYGEDQNLGPFPAHVLGLDENFIVIRRAANLGLPPSLFGFHLYGTELVACARDLGLKCYAIDFHLRHLSGGTYDQSYFSTKNRILTRRVALRKGAIHASAGHQAPIYVSRSLSISQNVTGFLSRIRRNRWRRRCNLRPGYQHLILSSSVSHARSAIM